LTFFQLINILEIRAYFVALYKGGEVSAERTRGSNMQKNACMSTADA
jgi:hypothetical protein